MDLPPATQLSDLSSDPLINILSCLPFKESVRFSVLSRCWQSLWLSSQNVELFEKYFVSERDAPEAVTAHRLDFIAFVRRWMENFENSRIESFKLRLEDPRDFPEEVNQSIALAISKGVKQLEIDFSNTQLWDIFAKKYLKLGIDFHLLPAVYEHNGLTSLTLSWCVVDFTKFGENLAGLKELCLGYLEIDNDTIPLLVNGCPLLEKLTLTRCWNRNRALYLKGEAPNLQTLVIDECFCKYGRNWFEFKAPNLKVFKFFGMIGNFQFDFGNDLKEAELNFGLHENMEPYGILMYNLLMSISSTRALTVCSYILQVFLSWEVNSNLNTWVKIPFNVTHLTLNTSLQRADLWGVNFFLKSCHLLETLTIIINPQNILENYGCRYKLARQRFKVPNVKREYECLLRRLKVVEVKGFMGSREEMLLLKRLIKYGRVLMEVKLYFSQCGRAEHYHKLVEKLRAVSRVSPRLHILAFD